VELVGDQTNFRDRLGSAIQASEDGDTITIQTTDGVNFAVHGQVFLGGDFIEFQPEDRHHRLLVIPFDKIARVML
jgi:hypothetical protein